LDLLFAGVWLPLSAQAGSAASSQFAQAVHARPDFERGTQLFRDCAVCHGSSGGGSEDGDVPRLAGQHYEYLLRQMYDAVDGRRPNFSRSHVRLLARLERADLVGLADFLARSDWTGPVAHVTQVRSNDRPFR
jgi:cytochrome c553